MEKKLQKWLNVLIVIIGSQKIFFADLVNQYVRLTLSLVLFLCLLIVILNWFKKK